MAAPELSAKVGVVIVPFVLASRAGSEAAASSNEAKEGGAIVVTQGLLAPVVA